MGRGAAREASLVQALTRQPLRIDWPTRLHFTSSHFFSFLHTTDMKPILVGDKYQPDRRLGRGAYGEVYLGASISCNIHDKVTNTCRP